MAVARLITARSVKIAKWADLMSGPQSATRALRRPQSARRTGRWTTPCRSPDRCPMVKYRIGHDPLTGSLLARCSTRPLQAKSRTADRQCSRAMTVATTAYARFERAAAANTSKGRAVPGLLRRSSRPFKEQQAVFLEIPFVLFCRTLVSCDAQHHSQLGGVLLQ